MTTVVACPACQQNLQVPDEQLGQPVRCAGCAHIFTPTNTAVRSSAAPAPPPVPADEVPAWERRPEDELAKPLDEDEAAEVDEAERRKRKKERKSRNRGSPERGYYGELARKRQKMLTPHRGVMVLVLGIVSLLFCGCSIFAIGACAAGYYAYQMGTYDLQEIAAGRMDPSGQTMDSIGRILGIIGMILSAPVILLSLVGLILTLVRAIAA